MSVPTNNPLPFGLPSPADASPQSLGWVYSGDDPMTDEDEVALNNYLDSLGYPTPAKIDPFSVKGKHHRDWSTYRNKVEGTQANGGLGSDRFAQQWVDPLHDGGVNFCKPGDTMWYTDSNTGESLKGFPPDCGAFHEVNVGGGYSDAFSGPRPGSMSEEILGDSEYLWSDFFGWYEVKQ